ncbi:O-antigen ligase family protein [Neobacillus pocheonensis]|uniref:O-antigen ligase family protein n=1 Tax=Neobacillus pocheonensis TaxID=363869 RepID=UPI003D2D8811
MITLQSKMPQIILGVIASIFLGWLSFQYLTGVSLRLFIVACICFAAGLLMFARFRQFFWEKLTLQHFLLTMMIATSFLGSAFFAVSAGPIQLFPYRILLMFLVIVLFIKCINKDITLQGHFQLPYLYFFLLAWITYSFLAISWSVELTSAIKEVITLITGILITFLVTFLYKKEENYLEFFTVWVVMGLLLIGIGFINHFLQIHLPISRINHVYAYQKGIPTSVFVNENDFASFLAITIFFFLSLIKNGRRMIYQLIGLFGFLSCVYLILITESRANYIGVFLGCVFWFIFILRKTDKMKIVATGLLIAPIIIIDQLHRVKALWEFVKTQVDSLFIPSQELSPTTSIDIRENLLRNAQIFIENTFGFGVGPGNVEFYMKNTPVYPTHQAYNVHNWWAEIFVQYGFLIFTGYIIMYLFLFFTLFRIWRLQIRNGNSLISEALLCGMVAFLFASISPNSFMALNYNWLFTAFLIAYTNYHYKDLSHPGGLQ